MTATTQATRIWTREEIANKIATDLKWLCGGILAIWNRQTEDEKNTEETRHHNGVGFNGRDARFLSSIAQQINQGRRLSEKQTVAARKAMVKYTGQLTKIANKKIA